MLARANLHLEAKIPLKNVSEDPEARDHLVKLAGKDQAPCLVADGRAMHESKAIIAYMVTAASDIAA
jgi:glutathione S-transferase